MYEPQNREAGDDLRVTPVRTGLPQGGLHLLGHTGTVLLSRPDPVPQRRAATMRQIPMSLKAISPLDGRYARQTAELAEYFSEYALIRYRVLVETEWLIALSEQAAVPEVRPFTAEETARV